MRLVTLDEYIALPRPSQYWMIRGLLPKPGVLLLTGAPKCGKSFIALQIGLSIARGRPLWGRPVRQGRVLLFQFDTSELVWRHRLMMLKWQGLELEGTIWQPHPEDVPDFINVVDGQTHSFLTQTVNLAQPDVVIVDVLRETHNADENDSMQMKVVVDRLLSYFKGCAVVLLHHTRKLPNLPDHVDPIDPINSVRGSSYLAGKVDSTWLLHKPKLYTAPRFSDPLSVGIRQRKDGFFDLDDASHYTDLLTKLEAFIAKNRTWHPSKLCHDAELLYHVTPSVFFEHYDPVMHSLALPPPAATHGVLDVGVEHE